MPERKKKCMSEKTVQVPIFLSVESFEKLAAFCGLDPEDAVEDLSMYLKEIIIRACDTGIEAEKEKR